MDSKYIGTICNISLLPGRTVVLNYADGNQFIYPHVQSIQFEEDRVYLRPNEQSNTLKFISMAGVWVFAMEEFECK